MNTKKIIPITSLDCKMIKTTLTDQDKISIHTASGGGLVARINKE